MGEQFQNLVDMFEKSVERYAANPLFGVKEGGEYKWITYKDVGQQVKGLRGGLSALGVGKGDTVAIIANNSPAWAAGAYATYGLAARYVPMYEAQLAKDWKYIINDSGAKVLIVANDLIAEKCKDFVEELETLEFIVNIAGPESDAHSFAGLIKTGLATPVDPIYPEKDDICGLIYTSGTTGMPKGVLLSHWNLTSNVNAVHEVFPMDQTDRSLSFLPWAHSFGQTVELHTLLSYGASMGLAESVQTIIQNLTEVKPSLLFSVPRIFNRIYDGVHKKMAAEGGLKKTLFERTLTVANKRRALAQDNKSSALLDLQFKVLDKLVGQKIRDRFGGRLRYAFSGGAALSKEVAIFIDNLGITVYEGYGLTETSPICTVNCPDGQRIGSIGRAIPGVEIKIIPFESAPEGQGEIVVYGPNVMKGYHNLPKETEETFTEDGGFKTGDMGHVDADGFVWITGRVKEQYKLENGKYVVPAPLEEKLKLSGYIANIMIHGVNKPYNVAVIVPDVEMLASWAKDKGLSYDNDEALIKIDGVEALINEEIQKYGKDFKGYERPRKFVLTAEDFTTENDMLTPSMKIKRRKVLETYEAALNGLF
ncbi:MAG: long-chain fatty acid--CoA ligase [Deltaproteobacteria bacterium CG2_30_63_29]|nr:MAG: long-chain fatty acid--CoA ligase [Deltaproteobacteria bacterium CG2_30_63_29]PIW01252.1 MAG: long-chain fatty acid--CoA ligase [Deltaproteobacteria bacterium CG17_big_fil_post_rev_8_21_14_2_50_63_7]